MIQLVASMVIVFVIAALLIWGAVRAWRSRRGVVRWLLGPVASLFALALTAGFVLAVVGAVKLFTPPYNYPNQTASVPVTGGTAQVARGRELAMLCAGCHSTTGNLPLDGSADNFLAGGPPMGVLYAPNLTPSGPLKNWTDAQIARAIREGVDNQGHPLVIMPSGGFHGMSDADVYSIVAYLRSQPPSPHNPPPPDFTALAAALLGAGGFPDSAQPPVTSPITAPPRAATAEYGHYLTTAIGCRDCHGENLTGGTAGGSNVPAPNLFTVVTQWNQPDFLTFFRTGAAPGGKQVDPDVMPWKDFSKILTDQDLQALYLYLHSAPPKNNGS